MAEKTTPMPMSAADAVAYFQCCGDAFACLSTSMGAIQDDDNPFTTDALIVAGIHVADRFARLANTWREVAVGEGCNRERDTARDPVRSQSLLRAGRKP